MVANEISKIIMTSKSNDMTSLSMFLSLTLFRIGEGEGKAKRPS